MMYPLVTDLAVDGVAVSVSCRVLDFSTQAYYRWLKNPVSQRDFDDAHLINAALKLHGDDPTYGYRFIKDELETVGIVASEKRVNRLCTLQSIWSIHARKRGLSRKPGPPVHDDLVRKDFTATGPNLKWLTDITEHPTSEGRLYVCLLQDLWSKRIVGYSTSERMTSELATRALQNAIDERRPAATIVHSDRGSQFRSTKYVHLLSRNGLKGSMGRVGACGDNAAMESFNALLQVNVLNRQRWQTRDELSQAITTWIETKYHRRRRQRQLGRQTPINFEKLNQPPQQAA
jgi:putative transposase